MNENSKSSTSAPAECAGLTFEDIHRLPKAELHCHLDGSMRLSTIIELAREQKVELPTFDEEALARHLKVGLQCRDLDEYLEPFDTIQLVLQEKDALERAAYELACDCAAENVLYLEVRYSPVWHCRKGLTWRETVDAVLAGLRRAEKEHDIKCNLILCGIRSMTPDVSKALAELAVEYKGRGVVGYDLAGSEAHNPAKDHIEAFYVVKNNNVNITLHAGEMIGPPSIHQALHYCGADRIGQGTYLSRDGNLVNYVNDHRIPLEICLTSSLQTGAVEELSFHPFPFYFTFGLRVTLNTDNRLISDTTLSKEYWKAACEFDLTMDDIKRLIINSFKSAFLPLREKQRLLMRVLSILGKRLPTNEEETEDNP